MPYKRGWKKYPLLLVTPAIIHSTPTPTNLKINASREVNLNLQHLSSILRSLGGTNMLSSLQNPLILTAGVVVGFLLLRKLSQSKTKNDSPEPPCVPGRIPYIGHAIGLFWYRTGYYTDLRYVKRANSQ